jgi:hypothetical protein
VVVARLSHKVQSLRLLLTIQSSLLLQRLMARLPTAENPRKKTAQSKASTLRMTSLCLTTSEIANPFSLVHSRILTE